MAGLQVARAGGGAPAGPGADHRRPARVAGKRVPRQKGRDLVATPPREGRARPDGGRDSAVARGPLALSRQSAAYLSSVGRPVLMAGTCSSAARKAASDSAANALMPARSNSLFLAGRVSWAARSFNWSSTRYSGFGMVKLSRTIFGFLDFAGLTSLSAPAGSAFF